MNIVHIYFSMLSKHRIEKRCCKWYLSIAQPVELQ